MPDTVTRTARDQNGAPMVDRSRTPVLDSVHFANDGIASRLVIGGGLHYIRGNSAPYFSLTATLYETRTDSRGRARTEDVAGGCMHEEILQHRPDLADLAALHLSDIDGKPMHAEANGWYDLAGTVPGAFGERYHAGNSKRHFPKPDIDPAKPWQKTDYREPTLAEALQIFADHIRAPLAEAERVRAIVTEVYTSALASLGEGDGTYAAPPSEAPRQAAKLARARWAEICASYTERWQREARECIARHDLVIWGSECGLREASAWPFTATEENR
jgi:hypothetical protein